MNIVDRIHEWAARAPDAAAIRDGAGVISFRQLDTAVLRAAAALATAGCAPGMTVGICLRGTMTLHVVVMLALARLGAIQLVVSPYGTAEARAALLRRLRPAIVVTDHAVSIEGIVQISAEPRWLAATAPPAGDVPRHPGGDAPWTYVLSSGSTGPPKAVLLTHAMEIARDRQQPACISPVPGERCLDLIPIEFRGGRHVVVRYLSLGATMVAMSGAASGGALLEQMAAAGVTFMFATPSQLGELVPFLPDAEPLLPRLRLRTNSGGMPSELLGRLQRGLTPQVFVDYGANDAGTMAIATPQDLAGHPGTVGRVLPGIELQIVDEAHRPLPAGSEGQVRVRGPGVARGYLDNPEAAARAFRDGWFYPGDIAELDSEGRLFVRRRSDNLINFGGVILSPQVIETQLRGNPLIADVAVFAFPSTRYGSIPAAAIVARDRSRSQEIYRLYRQMIGGRAPLHILLMNRLPRNEVGKVSHDQLVSRFRAQLEAQKSSS